MLQSRPLLFYGYAEMKKLVGLALLVLASGAYADGVKFEKDNGTIEIQRVNEGVEFLINSSVGQYTCKVKGIAQVTSPYQISYVSNKELEGEDKCHITIDFAQDVSGVKVTTDSCNYYCGMKAVYSMDGDYKKAN
jgi:hypothetical protein